MSEEEVRAFGSCATGQLKPYSDLDLVIMTDQPLTLGQLTELTDAFADSDLPGHGQFRADHASTA